MSTTQGCLGEHIFITECIKRNIQINQPINDIFGYDFVIKTPMGYKSIQVKTTLKADMRYPDKPSYKIQVRKGANSEAYKRSDFDYLAAYIISLDIWYIIPFKELNKTTIRVNPESSKCKYAPYKMRFDLIGGVTHP